ncbi:MAG: hypothetical protein RL326_675 [Pseudomonadota bacterium]
MLDSLATFDGKLSPLVTMSSNRFRGVSMASLLKNRKAIN